MSSSTEVGRGRALVIVPTYNERENVRRLIETVLEKDARIDMLVVDDGSPDGTGAIVEEIAATNERVHLLSRPRKMGLGTAYIAGFRWALARDYEFHAETSEALIQVAMIHLMLRRLAKGGQAKACPCQVTQDH